MYSTQYFEIQYLKICTIHVVVINIQVYPITIDKLKKLLISKGRVGIDINKVKVVEISDSIISLF